MRTYEFMLILRPEADGTEKKIQEVVKKLLDKVGGTITSLAVWGKRTLAYPIAKATEGIYVLATIEGNSIKSAQLEKEVKMGNNVLRFMLTVK